MAEIVSPGTDRTDRTTKFAEYAEVGIEHYWIVDLDGRPTLAAWRLIDLGPRCAKMGGAPRSRGDYEQTAAGSGVVELSSPASITLDLDGLVSDRA